MNRLLTIVMVLMQVVLNVNAQSAKSDSLFALGVDLYNAGRYNEAISVFNECNNLDEVELDIENLRSHYSVMWLASCYYQQGDSNKAKSISEYYKFPVDRRLTTKSDSLANLGLYLYNNGDFVPALEKFRYSFENLKNVIGENHIFYTNTIISYAEILENLAEYYSEQGDNDVAIKLSGEVLDIRAKVLGEEHTDYAKTLDNLALYDSKKGNNRLAIEMCRQALKIIEKNNGKENLDYVNILGDLAFFNFELSNYSEAVLFYSEVLQIIEKIQGKNTIDYAIKLDELAKCYYCKGEVEDAISRCKTAIQIFEKNPGQEHEDYAIALGNLATFYGAQGNYDEAISKGSMALQILEIYGKENINYANALGSLANFYFMKGNINKAIQLNKEALLMLENTGRKNESSYGVFLGNRAMYKYIQRNFDEAISLFKEVLTIIENNYGQHHPIYAHALGMYALCYSSIDGYINDAIILCNLAISIQEKCIGKSHPDYAALLSVMAWLYYLSGDVGSTEKYVLSYYDVFNSIIHKNFSSMTEYERSMYWEKYKEIFSLLPHFYSYVFLSENLIKCSYNASLLSKGLLLNLSRSMSELIQSSGDQEALSLYNDIRLNRMTLQKQYERPIAERTLNTDSLEALTADMERELIKKSKIFGDYTKDMSIQWEDVQQRLDSFDIAIEFVDSPIVGTDSTMYVALTLKKEYNCPHMISLFEKRQLTNIPKKDIYCNTDMYNLVWQPLEEELTGVKNIYFSPSGELHRIAIEYVPVTATDNISDRYEIRRLSSTRQLATIIDEAMGEKSVVYGGLEYDAIVSDTIMRVSSGQKRDFAYVPYVNVDSLKLRSSYKYLPGSKEEADSIVALLSSQSIPYTYFCDNVGTEESFKHLDGTKPKILHIATHGFYWTEEDAKQHDFRFLLMNERKPLREDKAMTRSGLLLSGCNRALKHETIPEQIEDGILTAEEISKLDLRGLDLVILSACQTGLGDIISGEGVFGLQRGFKKAGAKTIIMSLWKVDDDATNLLMKEFYKNYCSGKVDKRKSLRLAQKAVRKYKRFDSPYYWAAFVMLD